MAPAIADGCPVPSAWLDDAPVSPADKARLRELDRRYRWFEVMLPRCRGDRTASIRVLQQMTDTGAEMTAILLGEDGEPPDAA
jgi:hypothetical protein